MAVKRIVPNIASDQLEKAKSFYAEILDMEVAMNLEWIVTFAAASNADVRGIVQMLQTRRDQRSGAVASIVIRFFPFAQRQHFSGLGPLAS